MPFAPWIRKEILLALEKHVIPALWERRVSLGYVAPPLLLPPALKVNHLSEPLPQLDDKPVAFPLQNRWTKANLHATHHAYLGFLYEGAADERTLITASQENLGEGVYAIRWQAPSALLFPSGAPRNAGGQSFWNGAEPRPPVTKILWLALCDEILVHTHIKTAEEPVAVSHSLHVNDASLLTLAGLLDETLRQSPVGNQDAAQAVLLTMMLRLQDHLRSHRVGVANTARPVAPLPSLNARRQNACEQAANFIQMRLHAPLSLPLIAREAGLSPTHLNRLFRQNYDVSVMQFVRRQRLAAAKLILADGLESVDEIATLLNFKRASAFCSVFRRETGLTPGQFRSQAVAARQTSHVEK